MSNETMHEFLAKLHSRYNPQLEAQRYLDALKIDKDINCFILIEPGMGYMIPVLRKNRPDCKILFSTRTPVSEHWRAFFRGMPYGILTVK